MSEIANSNRSKYRTTVTPPVILCIGNTNANNEKYCVNRELTDEEKLRSTLIADNCRL
ncbi:MAG: hypothetical protein JWQ28_1219 [Pedobacter sp.]|jgi:hypothetical protein|nr:hypothetical protein [Pedobacter sp.]